ncbi:hypothetical protein QYE76_024246 [Lolium multiflorum]|uniref:Amino acid transporter transmembrane domain-containing protein n=1 Tax=Lolium multiflorum TaxID=4521 RepID=A0AAD8REQ8_LOLMU|nr:hypothetical protein QYE76_024246 [Lolium multiflorum]
MCLLSLYLQPRELSAAIPPPSARSPSRRLSHFVAVPVARAATAAVDGLAVLDGRRPCRDGLDRRALPPPRARTLPPRRTARTAEQGVVRASTCAASSARTERARQRRRRAGTAAGGGCAARQTRPRAVAGRGAPGGIAPMATPRAPLRRAGNGGRPAGRCARPPRRRPLVCVLATEHGEQHAACHGVRRQGGELLVLPAPHDKEDSLLTPLLSQPKTFANVFIAVVGSGVLGLPYTFSRTGWAAGSILLLAVAGWAAGWATAWVR